MTPAELRAKILQCYRASALPMSITDLVFLDDWDEPNEAKRFGLVGGMVCKMVLDGTLAMDHVTAYHIAKFRAAEPVSQARGNPAAERSTLRPPAGGAGERVAVTEEQPQPDPGPVIPPEDDVPMDLFR